VQEAMQKRLLHFNYQATSQYYVHRCGLLLPTE